tara:strand:+ start:127 stop:381 length:255 start_codon:yes stop_codon:yes gene_type:complete
MAKKQKREPVLTLDGEEYFVEDLTAEQLRIKDHMADISNKLNTNMFIGEQLQISRDAFVNLFRASLESDDKEKPEVKEAELVEA